MRPLAERWLDIVAAPAASLHPAVLPIPADIDSPALRDTLDRLLTRAADCHCPATLSPIARLWVETWADLPRAALLLGAQAAWPWLARGGRLCQLEHAVRAFAACPLSPRLAALPAVEDLDALLQAIGLQRFLQWQAQVPAPLPERLARRFSPMVRDLRHLVQPVRCEATLLTLAVQHARLYPDNR